MASREIINILSQYLNLLVDTGIPVEKGLLFGSYATGDYTDESDLDLLVISPLFDQAKTGQILDTLWRLRRKIDPRIEPIAVGTQEFDNEGCSPLIDVARRQGIEIKPS